MIKVNESRDCVPDFINSSTERAPPFISLVSGWRNSQIPKANKIYEKKKNNIETKCTKKHLESIVNTTSVASQLQRYICHQIVWSIV